MERKCKECYSEQLRQDRINNPEKYKQYHKNSYNYDKAIAYYYANKDRVWQRFYDSPKRKNYDRQYYIDNKDILSEKKKAYYQTPAGKLTINRGNIKRRELLANCIDTLTAEEWLGILKSQNYKCIHCGIELKPNEFDLDHIVPLSKKGNNVKENVQGLCEHCNEIKHNKIESLAMEMILKGLQ